MPVRFLASEAITEIRFVGHRVGRQPHRSPEGFTESDIGYYPFMEMPDTGTVIPEPSSLAIFGFGAFGLVASGLRRRKQKTQR